MSPQPCFVGLDVAQATLDIAVRPTAEPWQVNNDAPGMTTLVPQRQALAPTLIVLEAPGSSQSLMTAALATAGLPGVVVNARQVRAFAQVVGLLAKTERIDARECVFCRGRTPRAPAAVGCQDPGTAGPRPAATAGDRDADRRASPLTDLT